MKIELFNDLEYKPYKLNPLGDKIDVQTNNERHYMDVSEPIKPDYVAESFSEALKNSVKTVNDQQIRAEELAQKMIYEPDSVKPHEVMIASEKARVSLLFAKNVTEGFIRAYRELSTLR